MGPDLMTRRTSCAPAAVRRRPEPNALAAAVRDELDRLRSPVEAVAAATGSGNDPVVIRLAQGREPSGPALVALDDDTNAAALTAYGLAEATRRSVPLRTVYVWTDCRPPDCDHHRACHRDLGDATQLLADILEEHLSSEELDEVERDVLHDTDPVRALAALSDRASLLVVGTSSRLNPRGLLGDTTRGLITRARCPLAVVPTAPHGLATGLRRPARSAGTSAPDRPRPPGRG